MVVYNIFIKSHTHDMCCEVRISKEQDNYSAKIMFYKDKEKILYDKDLFFMYEMEYLGHIYLIFVKKTTDTIEFAEKLVELNINLSTQIEFINDIELFMLSENMIVLFNVELYEAVRQNNLVYLSSLISDLEKNSVFFTLVQHKKIWNREAFCIGHFLDSLYFYKDRIIYRVERVLVHNLSYETYYLMLYMIKDNKEIMLGKSGKYFWQCLVNRKDDYICYNNNEFYSITTQVLITILERILGTNIEINVKFYLKGHSGRPFYLLDNSFLETLLLNETVVDRVRQGQLVINFNGFEYDIKKNFAKQILLGTKNNLNLYLTDDLELVDYDFSK